MKNSIKIGRKIVKGGRALGATGHIVKMAARKDVRKGANRLGKIGKAGHRLKVSAKRQARKAIRRGKKYM